MLQSGTKRPAEPIITIRANPPPLNLLQSLKRKKQLKQQSSELKNPSSPEKQVKSPSYIQSPLESESPTKKRKPQTFITQRRVSDVQSAHEELNSYIDKLDQKINNLINKHEAEFLIAYRNHVKKVREQMDQIRKKALTNANSSVSHMEKIQMLEKQLTIFRDESLKLFEKVTEHENTIYTLVARVKQLQKQKQHLQSNVKILTRRNKQLEGSKFQDKMSQNMVIELDSKISGKSFKISRPQQRQSKEQNQFKLVDMDRYLNGGFFKSRPHTTAINSKGTSNRSRNHSVQLSRQNQRSLINDQIMQINSKLENLLALKIDQQLLKQVKQQISTVLKDSARGATQLQKSVSKTGNYINTASKTNRSFFQSKAMAKRSQLQQYFMKSIEEVKKQITRRKGLKSLNFYSQYANLTISQFKKLDFFRMLQIFFSNQKAIIALFRSIFGESKDYK